MKKRNDREAVSASYTSVYLDSDSRGKLDDLSTNTGQSRSQVIRSLIQGADGERDKRLAEIAAEMADLLVVR